LSFGFEKDIGRKERRKGKESFVNRVIDLKAKAGNTKGGSITVPLTSCLTSLESVV
jgi:hypothetical protein